MILRDCMVYGGIQTSRRVARLNWFQQVFFRSVFHVCDDYGRFEADAGMLRTVLFAPQLGKVPERDVKDALLRCAEQDVGLVKLYAVRGRGYGKVVNYRQDGLRKRRALYPGEDDQDEPDLFTSSPPSTADPPSRKKERRKEGARARGAAPAPAPACIDEETESKWIARLEAKRPDVHIREQLMLALADRRKKGRALERLWFENSWLKNCSRTYNGPSTAKAVQGVADITEPEAWRAHLKDEHEGEDWAERAASYPWESLPRQIQERISNGMSKRSVTA